MYECVLGPARVWSVVGAADAAKVVAGGQNVVPAIPFGLGVAGAGRLEFCTLLFTVTAARREAATAMAAGRVASVEEKLEPVVVAADAWGRRYSCVECKAVPMAFDAPKWAWMAYRRRSMGKLALARWLHPSIAWNARTS